MKNSTTTLTPLQAELQAAQKPGIVKRFWIYLGLTVGAAIILGLTSCGNSGEETPYQRASRIRAERNDPQYQLSQLQRPVIVMAKDSTIIMLHGADGKMWAAHYQVPIARALMCTYQVGDTLK